MSQLISPRMNSKQTVPPVSHKVSSLDQCSNACEFGCEEQSKKCLCLRGYEMTAEGCQDIDECTSKKHNCHVQSMCNNTIGGFMCTCNDGYWGDGITCKACSTKSCPENFYQSESCTRTHDRVCTDISKPLTVSKALSDKDLLDGKKPKV
ncbi:uromodulin-like [Orbicella faveolata]|uniref:uromodulin-like n=1 Tax=Orbicella faveolata TaxID=48498 RepID=UPI0009E3B092|nr:uromodulin-like [Orbicella faveolata]